MANGDPHTPLQKSLWKLAGATVVLYVALMLVLGWVYISGQSQKHANCLTNQHLAQSQVTSLRNLQASAKEFRDHARNPQVRAFFKVSYTHRTDSLKKAKATLKGIHCGT